MDPSKSHLPAIMLVAAGFLLNGCASAPVGSWTRVDDFVQPVPATVGRTGPGDVARAREAVWETTGGALLGAVTAGLLYGPAAAALGAAIGTVAGIPDPSQNLGSPARDAIVVPAIMPLLVPDPTFLEPGSHRWIVRSYPGAGDPYAWLTVYAASLDRRPRATCLRVDGRFSREGCEIEPPTWIPGWSW